MHTSVTIHGDGVAACACARLLQKQGLNVSYTRAPKSAGPTLLINAGTRQLLLDVFEMDEDFFATLPAIRQRVVLWGTEPKAVLPHAGLVVNESLLLEKLWDKIALSTPGESGWSIYSGSTIAKGSQKHFGSRVAHTAQVRLRETAAETCWVESVASGWLFLLPSEGDLGSLIAMGKSTGGTPAQLLSQSRLIANQVDCVTASSGSFPAYPRILDPLCASGWLACGSAAMSFDPICGEGVGNAVREAILASAVVQNPPTESLLSDYSTRLLLGFLRHLDACRRFYTSASQADWWQAELSALDQGIEWTRNRLSTFPKPQYRMVDFRLEPVS